MAKWRDKGINLRVAVNISARQLANQTIFTALKQVLQELNFEYCPIDVKTDGDSVILRMMNWHCLLFNNLAN